MRITRYPSIESAIQNALILLHKKGVERQLNKWQSVDAPEPMIEVLDVDFKCPMIHDLDTLKELCQPSLPWADLHFEERIGGKGTNPGDTYKLWPYWQGEHLDQENKFTHTYQERIWPNWKLKEEFKINPKPDANIRLSGVRYEYGDLDDVIELLYDQPDTRQAFLPIWYPEDTGARHGRVPCTIGYHFQIRDHKLHVRYYMRSCDARRHFRDDIYLCVRLAQYIAGKLKPIQVGDLTMNISNFHIFSSDAYWLAKTVNKICAVSQ